MNVAQLTAALSRYTGLVFAKLTGKVDKVEGKQLSTEDYSTEEKTKLEGVKSMAMRDLHVSTEQPDNAVGVDGDIWLTIRPTQP
ncbi:hypothetical protein D3C76_26020 [compost metagenome]